MPTFSNQTLELNSDSGSQTMIDLSIDAVNSCSCGEMVLPASEHGRHVAEYTHPSWLFKTVSSWISTAALSHSKDFSMKALQMIIFQQCIGF